MTVAQIQGPQKKGACERPKYGLVSVCFFLPRSPSPLHLQDLRTFTKQIWPQRPSKIAGVALAQFGLARDTPTETSAERVTHVLDNNRGEGGEHVCALSYRLAEHVWVCGMCSSCASARKVQSQQQKHKLCAEHRALRAACSVHISRMLEERTDKNP